jgi:hypothetical protein
VPPSGACSPGPGTAGNPRRWRASAAVALAELQDFCYQGTRGNRGKRRGSWPLPRVKQGRKVTKLIYIGGYGHSGSTLLEYLMAGSPAVLACGEVVSTIRERKKRKCTCGQMPKACPVWSFLHSEERARITTHAQLLGRLIRNVGDRYSAIVDSSKTAWGALSSPFRLRRAFDKDFILVHLTRQPAGACWSVLKKKSLKAKAERRLYSDTLRCGWTVLGWSIANLSCELFGLMYPNQYVHLRYEDLVHAPIAEIRDLLAKVLPGVSWRFGESGESNNRHQLYGNAVRYRPPTIESVREDLKWKTEMPRQYFRVVWCLSLPLRLRYGY